MSKFNVTARITYTKVWIVEADNEEHAEAIYFEGNLGPADLTEEAESEFLYAEKREG